ncbi:MAG: hypothetical protein HZC29_05680 [Thaumarchaeota archaeon]|nr:hypothetical protein [Nitrososphaerota archaeon]
MQEVVFRKQTFLLSQFDRPDAVSVTELPGTVDEGAIANNIEPYAQLPNPLHALHEFVPSQEVPAAVFV